MKNRLIKIFKKQKYDQMEDLITKIKSVRKTSDTIVFCPSITASSWKGVNVATKNLFGSMVVELPQYYSNSLLSSDQLEELANLIQSCLFQQLVFSGFLPYMGTIIQKVGEAKASIVFHGTLSELMDNAVSRNGFREMERLTKEKRLHKLGFVKKGLAQIFSKFWDIPCYELPLTVPQLEVSVRELQGINIGVFGVHNFNKNIINQVYAALLIPEAKIHIIGYSDIFDNIEKNRIILHPANMSHEEFLCLLGSMSLNLHISFSESWGQIVTESLALGVPCLCSDNNGIFDKDDFLAKKLLVQQYDNPQAIAEQITKVLKERELISIKGKEYIILLNSNAKSKLEDFIGNKEL